MAINIKLSKLRNKTGSDLQKMPAALVAAEITAEDRVAIYLQGRGKSKKEDRSNLGLSSVNHITQLHGGRVVYRKSKLGGACFELHLKDDPTLMLKNQGVA